MYKFILLLPVTLLFACSGTNDNGGVCTYVTDTVGATIVRMDSTGTPYPDILLHVTRANGDLDSIRYTNNTNENVTWEMCEERGWHVGIQLKTRHELRTSGHCDPEYFKVTQEVFK